MGRSWDDLKIFFWSITFRLIIQNHLWCLLMMYSSSIYPTRAVLPLGVSGPHWKKKSCLGPHIKYTNTNKNWWAKMKKKGSLSKFTIFVLGFIHSHPRRHVTRGLWVGHLWPNYSRVVHEDWDIDSAFFKKLFNWSLCAVMTDNKQKVDSTDIWDEMCIIRGHDGKRLKSITWTRAQGTEYMTHFV